MVVEALRRLHTPSGGDGIVHVKAVVSRGGEGHARDERDDDQEERSHVGCRRLHRLQPMVSADSEAAVNVPSDGAGVR